jgi:pimeloyl-ACP methyl ester carboxylesterase
MKWTVLPIVLLAMHTAAYGEGFDLRDRIDALGPTDCADSDLRCVTLNVPRNHLGNDPDATLPITFAVSLATDPAKGTLIYAVGGPGGSGLQVAQNYLDAMDPDLVAQMNIVFFDQRGVGPVHGFSCLAAQMALETTDMNPSDPDAAIALAQTYVTDCIAGISDKALLGFVDSQQAIRDIELFRQAIGAPQVWVYGESYGTQFAQEYATAYPDAISGVILDGVVDLTLSFPQFYRSYTAAAENILARVLAECDVIAACRRDMQGSATDAYDALAAQVKDGPVSVDFPLVGGGTTPRDLTRSMLENNAFYALYAPTGRADFLRALAAAQRGDLVPMLRLGYANFVVDSDTQAPVFDPSYFPASYYAINCADYAEAVGDPMITARAVLAEAAEYAKTNPRLLRTYFSERLVCALWPHQGDVARPAAFAGGDYPTLVLNSDTDPITPADQAYAVFDNVRNGHMVLMQGGPHVIFGWGLACPDQIVSRLVLDAAAPAAPLQLCEQEFVEGYAPLTLPEPGDSTDALAVAQGVEAELLAYPELTGWDGEAALSVACDHGGRMDAAPTPAGYAYRFVACALWPGLLVDGTATEVVQDGPGDGMTLMIAVSGTHTGELEYHNGYATESVSLSGTYDGKPAETPRPMP